jgi:tetratricopeptide (TPR) repeat protein
MIKPCRKVLLSMLLFALSFAFAQTREIDSLKRITRKGADDTTKIINLNVLSRQLFMTGEYDSSLAYAGKAALLAGKLPGQDQAAIHYSVQRALAASYNLKGLVYTNVGNYSQAISAFNKSLQISQEVNDKKGQATAYGNIGNVYYGQGNYTEAQRQFFSALKLREEVADKKGIAFSLVSIGNVYSMIRNADEAMNYYNKVLPLFKELDDRYSLAGTYNNIAGIYTSKKYYDKALDMYFSYLKIMEEFGDKQNIADTYNNIGNIYYYKGQGPEAIEAYEKALKEMQELEDVSGIALSNISIGDVYVALHNYAKAKPYLFKGFQQAKEVGELDLMRDAYEGMYNYYDQTGDKKQALENYKLFIVYNDSVNNEETTRETTRAQMNYEFEKKEASAKLEQEKKEAVSKAESKKKQIIIWCVGGMLCLAVCFSIYAYRISLQKQKANVEITRQKEIIEEKQKEIVDSIHYAKRIQTALLTSENYIDKALNKLNK